MAKSNNTAPTSAKTMPIRSDAEKREALRSKIEASEQRQAERSFSDQARDAADSAMGYVRANPLKAVAAVTIGALLIGAMTRPGRKAGRKVGRKTSRLAGAATDAALAYGLSLLDGASSAASKGQNKARAWQATAAKEGGQLSDYLIDTARRSGKRAGRTIDDLRSRIRH